MGSDERVKSATVPFQQTTVFHLPLVDNPTFGRVVPKDITQDLVKDPFRLYEHIKATTGEPLVGALDKLGKNLYATVNAEKLRQAYLEWVKGVQFELLIPRVKKAFVGDLQDSELHDDLRQCKQTVFEKGNRQLRVLPAERFHEAFIICLNTIKDTTQTDMAALFSQNFTKETRTAMEAAGFKIPSRPVNETRDQVYERVAAVKEWAVKAECGISANMQALARVTGNRLTAKSPALYGNANETTQLRVFMGRTVGEGIHRGFQDDDFVEAAALAEDIGISPEK
eukprot:1520411-Ditylum_brightwellii.AAC.1